MKNYFFVAVALAMFTGVSFAQTQVPAHKSVRPTAAAQKHAERTETIVGTISAIDAVGDQITVNGRVLGIDAGKIAALKVGNSVVIKARENKVVTINVVKTHEAKKTAMKK